MPIQTDDVKKIAVLAHLEFDEPALSRMSADLSRIVSYIDQLRGIDLEPEVLRAGASGDAAPLASDELKSSLPVDAVAGNAPQFLHGHFAVPRVIGAVDE